MEKPKKFKRKKRIATIISIPNIEKWIGRKRFPNNLVKELRSKDSKELDRLANQIFNYEISLLFLGEIDLAVRARLELHLEDLKREILVLGHGAFSFSKEKLDSQFEEAALGIDSLLSRSWTHPHSIWYANSNFSKTFGQIVKFRGIKKNEITRLRNEICLASYNATKDIEVIFRIYYSDKQEAKIRYEEFIENNILADPKLSVFLRRGKKLNSPITFESYQKIRDRTLRSAKRVR